LKRVTIICLIIFLIPYASLLSQIKEPGQPYIPEINSQNSFQNFSYKVSIDLQGKTGIVDYVIVLNSNELVMNDGTVIKINDISKITVLRWEKRRKLSKYLFIPSRYEINFRDGRKIIFNGNIDSLNRIKISNRKAYIYLYYYDYFKKGKWVNSGVSDFNGFSDKPAEGCALSIELTR